MFGYPLGNSKLRGVFPIGTVGLGVALYFVGEGSYGGEIIRLGATMQ